MKKELATHFSFLIALFILVSLFRGWLSLNFAAFWIGGIIGSLLPDFDHLIYAYFIRPHEVTSQRVASLVSQQKFLKTWELLALTRGERRELIFHTAHFQLIFVVFAFFVVTSTSGLLGRGIVVAFLLHLLIDQIVDLKEVGTLEHWFSKLPIRLDREDRRWYLIGNGVLILLFGFLF